MVLLAYMAIPLRRKLSEFRQPSRNSFKPIGLKTSPNLAGQGLKTIVTEIMTQNKSKIQGKFYPLQHEEWLRANRELKPAEVDVLYYLKTVNRIGERISIPCSVIASDLKRDKSTVSRAILALKEKNWLPEWFEVQFREQDNAEAKIRQRLRAELGGEMEVVTAVGRIDLLTESEVIEIKNINDWKEALGKILAYSAFFPEHSKRIHLFGKQDLAKLALATQTCWEFAVIVTFEEVQP